MSRKDGFATARVYPGDTNALVKTAMREIGTNDPNLAVRLVNSGVFVLQQNVHAFRVEDDVIYLHVITNGFSNEDWRSRFGIGYLHSLNWVFIDSEKDFPGKTSRILIKIAVLKGSSLHEVDRTLAGIHSRAQHRTFLKPQLETACLVANNLSKEDVSSMGIDSIVFMHDPVRVTLDGQKEGLLSFDGELNYLRIKGGDEIFHSGFGFAFEVSRTPLLKLKKK